MLKQRHKDYSLITGTLITFFILVLSSPVQSQENDELIEAVKQIEGTLGARIGIAVYDIETLHSVPDHIAATDLLRHLGE